MSLTAAVRLRSPVPQNRSGVEAAVAMVYFWLQTRQPNTLHCSKQWGVLSSAFCHQGLETALVSIPQQKPLCSLHYLQSHQALWHVLFHQTGTWWIDSWFEEPVMKTWCKLIMLSWTWRPSQGPGSLPHDYWVTINRFAASSVTAAS